MMFRSRGFSKDAVDRLSLSKNRKVLNVSNLEYVPRKEAIINQSLDCVKFQDGKSFNRKNLSKTIDVKKTHDYISSTSDNDQEPQKFEEFITLPDAFLSS